ncbi:hypothetical protein TTHERM_00161680 (macronuclear) [Tetrahymena thermophila SB210]|uniref:Uncharacterized protein n=1 Tax=Tetrahymena thermophila (strain SB210) TaxID=312017 RepID=Q22VW6_TETTS|nr:hypothetical protein TTHERM_00161680 [Tetrahymena thermophila SB210]EAR89650.1 hypothetical protein TTHERM_00161680 [Tetrahymena thermophila SB210]|eukprot:XP_001009896.1 hypothetical protein TTHERM_00161680 [Tetrahymena thermophila SB210]
MSYTKPSSFTHLDSVYLNSKNPFQDKKSSIGNLTLTVTKASLIESGAKSFADIDQSIKDPNKNVTLPSLDAFPQSFKSRVSPSTSVKRVSNIQKFDNQLQSYFLSTKKSGGFFSQLQTQAPPSPEKQDRKNNSQYSFNPQLSSNNQISLSNLTELNFYGNSQNILSLPAEISKQNARSLDKHQELNKQKNQQSQNYFNLSRQSIRQPQILKIDVLKDKQKIVQLINKDRKEKLTKSQVGQIRQSADSIVEKVKCEEKNFYVSFSILDTSAHRLLKNVKCNEQNKVKKRQNISPKKSFIDVIQTTQKENNVAIQNDQSQCENHEKNIIEHNQITDNDTYQNSENYIKQELQQQQDIQFEALQQSNAKISEISPRVEIISETEQKEEQNVVVDEQKEQENQTEKNIKYESLLSPIQELNSFKQSNDNYKRDSFYLKNDQYLSDNNSEIKISQYESQNQDRKTSVFKAKDQDFLTVTVISPKQLNQETENQHLSILKIPIKTELSEQNSLKLEEDLKRKDEKEDSNSISPYYQSRTPASRHSDKNVLFDLSQDVQKQDNTPANSVKSVQIQGILKKKTLLSVDGTDQSESDLTATNKQNKIKFSNIQRQKTVNTKQSPRKSYFKSFSQAINDSNSQNSQNDEDDIHVYKQKSDQNIKDKKKQKQKQVHPPSSEYADDEFKDRSESNISENTSFSKLDVKIKKGYKRSETNQKSDVSIEDYSPNYKQNKFKGNYKKYKSHQKIEEDDILNEYNLQRKSAGNIQSMKSIQMKKKKNFNKNEKSKSKNQLKGSSSEDFDDDDIESLYENMVNNDANNESSQTDINQDEIFRKKKSKRYSVQINDLAEFVEMEQQHALSIGSIASLFMKLHKAKKRALIHLKSQPAEPIRINEIEMSSCSDLENLSMLKSTNKKDGSQSNFNDYCEEYDQDSQTPGSFIIQSLADNFNDLEQMDNGSNIGEGTGNNKNRKNILHKLMTKKSLVTMPINKNQKLQQLKTKVFDRTPSNNFELRNVRKNEMHLLKQRIENLHKEFKIEGLKLDQKKLKMRKLIKEIEKINVKVSTQDKKNTQNLIQAINEELDYEKQTDEKYFEEIMSNVPIINEDLDYFQKMKQNKINDPKYIMKFEEQIKMNRERDFISELKKENVVIDDEMLLALQRNKIMNESDKAANERKNHFIDQTRILQKLGLMSLEDYYKQYQLNPQTDFIYQTELDYEKALQENRLIQQQNNIKVKANMKSIKLKDVSPQKILEKKIDKFLELSKKVKNLPVEKLNSIKAKLNQISIQTNYIEETDQFRF